MVNQSVIDIAKIYIKKVTPDLDLKKAYLFGSCAKGQENEDSDIDIALVIGNMTDFFSIQMQLMRLRRNIDMRIEPHPIGEDEFTEMNPFAVEIQNSGIELDVG